MSKHFSSAIKTIYCEQIEILRVNIYIRLWSTPNEHHIHHITSNQDKLYSENEIERRQNLYQKEKKTVLLTVQQCRRCHFIL